MMKKRRALQRVKSKKTYNYSVAVFGGGRVGKTSLIRRFACNEFNEADYSPTVEDYYQHVLQIQGNVFVLNLIDTSGSFEFPAMRHLHINQGKGFVVVFSVNDRDSFEEAKKILDELIESKGEDLKVILVASKCDLKEKDREIAIYEVDDYVKSHPVLCGRCSFIQTSAKANNNVTGLFYELLKMVKPEAIELPSIPPSPLYRGGHKKCKGKLRETCRVM